MKTYWITGTSPGIGEAMALQLGKETMGIYAKRFMPNLFAKLVSKAKVR
jgi:hypothetical protein